MQVHSLKQNNVDFPFFVFLILISWLHPKLWRCGLLVLKCLFLACEASGLGRGSSPAWRNTRWLAKDKGSDTSPGLEDGDDPASALPLDVRLLPAAGIHLAE